MASPSNPFAGLAQSQSQRNGATGRGGRGGTFGRPSRNPGAPSSRGSSPRGRGRGGAASAMQTARGRGNGTVNNNASRNKPESPFAQLKQDKPTPSPSPSPSPFGGKVSQQKSPFPSDGAGSGGPFGVPSFGGSGTAVDSSRDPRRRTATAITPAMNGATGSAVPVEDASILNSYNERYEQLKLDRAKEREMAIKEGLMADPNQPTSLNQAITPVGTCTSMCPDFERVERIVQKMVDKSEKFLHPSTNSLQYMETKMLKRFRRSAAGYDEQLPSDIRTPKTLLQTINYLMRHVIGGPEPLGLIHKFVWDRTRSVRNDLSVQQLTQEDHVRMAVTCLERIARFHIVSLHLLSSPDNEEPFDRHQEREQLNNTMLSLMYYYDDNRGRISFPNEDEFRAYYIIFSIHDQRPDLEARVQKWPPELRNSGRVQAALELFAASGNTWEYQGALDARRPNAIAQGFYTRFFALVDSPCVSYLMACVAEIYFNHIRQTAIRSIWKGYCRYPASQQHKNEEWTVDELTTVFCFDNDDQTIKFCEYQDLELAENSNGDLYLNWGSRPIDSVVFQPSAEHSFSDTYVESKRAGRSLVAIILGLSVKEAASLGMIDSSVLSERSLAFPAPKPGAFKEDDSLFVSDDENEIPAPSVTIDEPTPEITIHNDNLPLSVSSQPPPTGNGLSATQAEPAATIPQPPEPTKPFSSMFSDNFGGAPAAPAAPPSTTPNPFASVSSPFASLNTTTTNQPPGPFSLAPSPEKPNPMLDTSRNPFATAGQKTTEPTARASTTTQFKIPSVPQPPAPSPFGIPTTSTSTNQTTGIPAGQPPKIDSAKPPTFPSSTSSLFNLSGQSTAPKEPTVQEPQTTVSKPGPETPSLFAPKQNASPIFPSLAPATSPSSFSFAPKETTTSMSEPGAATDKAAVAEPVDTVKNPVDIAPPAEPEHVPSASEGIAHQGLPSLTQPTTTPAPTAPVAPEEPEKLAVPEEPVEPAIATEDNSVPAELAAEEPSIVSDAKEKPDAWLETLKEAAKKRREEFTASRKRAHDEPEEPQPAESGPKAAKMSKPEAPRPRKSMALSSIKPLPTLPILEQIKSTTVQKPTKHKPEPAKPKHNQIDEDELLLSAARIAAESLRSGPRLSDSWPSYSSEPPRSSFSPASSFSSSMPPLSGSQSPRVHGHELALAPDTDLGLGRTLSRTEQRLRLTGGKGLAYKPLDFTPEKKKRKSFGG